MFDRVFDPWGGLSQVIEIHGWMEFDVGVEGQEPGLRDRRYLRCVFQIEKDKRSPLTVLFGKISRFRLQVSENRFDGFG